MGHHKRVVGSCVRAFAGVALIALTVQGCGGAGGEPDELAGDESLATEEQGLHAYPGIPALSWRGAPPNAAQLSSNQPGLNVAYSLDVGITNKVVIGLQVCWYTPSNANNLYTPGDPIGCTIVGSTTANKWTRQQCPGDQVVAGYNVATNSAGNKIAKFGTFCKSLSNPSNYTFMPELGDQNILFTDFLSCQGPSGQVAYMEYFNSNNNFTGFNGVCVLR